MGCLQIIFRLYVCLAVPAYAIACTERFSSQVRVHVLYVYCIYVSSRLYSPSARKPTFVNAA